MFLWAEVETGEMLIAAGEIEAVHWRRNVREAQTEADVVMKSGRGYRLRCFPMAPVLHSLKEGGVAVLPARFEEVKNEEPKRDRMS